MKELQALPLERKIQISQTRIIEWYQHWNGNVVVSFSGGKDSTVLLHLVRQIYPDVRAVFSNTGLEYPEIQKFVKSHDNIDIVTPEMRFDQVISTYGYPLIGKEVAEAIYYARKIRANANMVGYGVKHDFINTSHAKDRRTVLSGKMVEKQKQVDITHAGGAEQTSQRKRTELCGNRQASERLLGQMAERASTPHTGTDTAQAFRDIVAERRSQQSQKSRDSKWGDYHRRCLHPNEQDERDRECFRNRTAGVATEYGAKSQYNKEKYLPLCRDVPVLISHYCCFKMKKSPMKKYQHANGLYPYLGTLAEESRIRKQGWIRHGCNAFDSKAPTSQPLSFWTEQDILAYIVKYGLDIAPVYGDIVSYNKKTGEVYSAIDCAGNVGCNLKCTGCDRTGCVFCGFGFHNEKGETRFQRLAKTHPRQYEYAIGGGQWVDNPHYDPVAPEWDGEWKNWNPKKIWVPSKKGLGMGEVFRMVNDIYGKDFYRYE